MVELSGVSFMAGGTPILHQIDVRFAAGKFNVILGPNGAGKSTLLKIATGTVQPTTGSVRYDNADAATWSPEAFARRRAVLSQQMELAFPLPVEDVVLMGRYPHYGRTPARRDREIVTAALELVGMADRRHQVYSTLSGGERQKTHLARVLAQIWAGDETAGPKYLFLDEPTASLDVHYQIHLLDVARGLLADGCTVIAILHDLNVALRYGDTFTLLAAGRVACATDRSDAISRELLEQVFKVRAHQVIDPVAGRTLWEFSL
ncbi:MAG TPA: heme ABC transporter ATP-binding protein [Gemmatimonadales bacterium]|jgi:iron complex transport system ATP-binding protein